MESGLKICYTHNLRELTTKIIFRLAQCKVEIMDFKKVLDDNKGIPLVVTIRGRATT